MTDRILSPWTFKNQEDDEKNEAYNRLHEEYERVSRHLKDVQLALRASNYVGND